MSRPAQGWVAWWRSRCLEVCAQVSARAELERLVALQPEAAPVAAAPVPPRALRKAKRRHAKRKARR